MTVDQYNELPQVFAVGDFFREANPYLYDIGARLHDISISTTVLHQEPLQPPD
jgi:hypothetical protein